ncbi:MAG: hypothetical protein ACE5H5_05460 [Nitrospinota bacterium]
MRDRRRGVAVVASVLGVAVCFSSGLALAAQAATTARPCWRPSSARAG